MSSHHRMAPGVPQAPPPPVLSSRARGPSRRSRSRSPAPRPQRRYRSNSRDRERGGRRATRSPPSRFGGSGRGRSHSRGGDSFRKAGSSSRQQPSAGGGGSHHSPPHSSRRSHSRQLQPSLPPSQSSSSLHPPPPSSHQHQQQSISLIPGDDPPRIIRRILDPNEVKLPRRPGEGARPIFERAELKEAMLRRQRLDDNEENPLIPGVPMQEPPQQQRVIAIIREPIDSYRASGYRIKEDLLPPPGYSSRRGLSPERPSGSKGSLGAPTAASNYHGRRSSRSISPPPPNSLRGGPPLQSSASQLAPQLRRSSRERSPIERVSSKRDLLYDRNERIRGDVDLREIVGREHNRERDVIRDSRAVTVGRSRSREKSGVRDRFGGHPNALAARGRSRSPVRIARDRRSRSRSDTPPSMPPEMRRKMMEKERDLRSKLSRPLTNSLPKFESDHDSRGRGGGRGGFQPRGGFAGRGGRGFARGFRSRAHEDSRSRGFWEHDLYDKDGVDDDLRGDSTKPNRVN